MCWCLCQVCAFAYWRNPVGASICLACLPGLYSTNPVVINRPDMISQKARYAFKALIALARVPLGQSMQIKAISEREHIPRAFLEHILLDLKRMRYVGSRRGKEGGYFLLKPAQEISFGDILWQIDGPMAPLGCLSRQAYQRCEDCPDEEACALRAGFAGIFSGQLKSLTSMSFARAIELAAESASQPQGYGASAFSGAGI